ncbi:MAG: hypothetical protein HY913_03425 [Desulfomonile tiedjei]|nr:hypothetical protein [Desulfomonile tiedjei]
MSPDKAPELLAEVKRLVGTLSRVTDVRQRAYALAFRLKGEDSSTIVDILRLIRERALVGHEDFMGLYNSLVVPDVFAEVLGKAKVSELVDAAQTKGLYDLVAFFLDMPDENPHVRPFQPFLDGTLKETPLGMRKALARKLDFKLIRRIARDQDHRVIKILLDNPRLTERDVVQIAATRPTSPQVLEEISKHPRWRTRYAVKKVVVFNPHSPLSLSLRLLAFMTLQDLEEIVNSPHLNPVMQGQAELIIEKKAGHGKS